MVSRYRMGFKRCTECNLFIKYEGTRCPCCSHVLRTKSRNRDNDRITRI
jgi:rRNA maturation endonuclease Nob1